MGNKIQSLHTTKHPVTVSGETWDKIEDCLLELLDRKKKKKNSATWEQTILDIAQECPPLAYRLVNEMLSQQQQIEAFTQNAQHAFDLINKAVEAAETDGRYTVVAEKERLVFCPKNISPNTKVIEYMAFSLSEEGLREALDWLKAHPEGASV